MRRRAPWGATALVLLAAAGIAVSAYLTVVHYADAPLVCSTGGVVDCAAVTSSTYSVVPGTSVPVTVPGLLWFAGSAALGVLALSCRRRRRPEPRWLRPAHVAWTATALIAVLYLVYGEIQLRRLCEWCTSVHLLVLASLMLTVARWQRAPAAEWRDATAAE